MQRWVTVETPELGTLRPCDGSEGYSCDCSIQFSQTTKGYWSALTGHIAATQICHAVSSKGIANFIRHGARVWP